MADYQFQSVTDAPIRANSVLPADREQIVLTTEDGLELIGELALPAGRKPKATLVTYHPLPTHGGFMDSHVYRKASFRLPELADIAVLRFNTRGTCSTMGCSMGAFGDGITERFDFEAALQFANERNLPNIYILGWSFGTELILRFGATEQNRNLYKGGILLSPPLRRATDENLEYWATHGSDLLALVPELDDFLTPEPARERFSIAPQIKVEAVEGARHLWVGEKYVQIVHNRIASYVLGEDITLPTTYTGEMADAGNVVMHEHNNGVTTS